MPYQTITLPDGTTVEGLFNTPEWAKQVFEGVDFDGKRFLDLGANTGQWSVEAFKRGARRVVLVDEQDQLLDEATDLLEGHGAVREIHRSKIEDWEPEEFVDIMLASMVIHWIDDAQTHLLRLLPFVTEMAIIVYRPDSPEAKVEGAGKWFPEEEELYSLMSAAGFGWSGNGDIHVPHDPSPINFAVFRRMDMVLANSTSVVKFGTRHNELWRERFRAISLWQPELFDHVAVYQTGSTDNVLTGFGYRTKLIRGTDLSGAKLFDQGPGHVDTYVPTYPVQKTLREWYKKLVRAFITSGYAFPDITPGNVILDGQWVPRLVDLSDIVPVLDLEHPHFHPVINRWLEFIGSSARFDGDLVKLLTQLEKE